MTDSRIVVTTTVVAVLLCTLHFFSAVYVSGSSQSRETNLSSVPPISNITPYNADLFEQTITAWALPKTQPVEPETATQNVFSAFDNARLGKFSVALLAIYQQKQAVAQLAVQSDGQPIRYIRLAQGENADGIQLTRVTRHSITLSLEEQRVNLRLFKPGSASSE